MALIELRLSLSVATLILERRRTSAHLYFIQEKIQVEYSIPHQIP